MFSSILSKLRSQFVLQKFNLKFFFLHLSFSQIRPNSTEFSVHDLWNGSTFPNYGSQKTSTTTQRSLIIKTRLFALPYQNLGAWAGLNRYFGIFYTYTTYLVQWGFETFRRSLGDGILYLRGLFLLFFFDAMLTDDEPLWEPIEWSLVQS